MVVLTFDNTIHSRTLRRGVFPLQLLGANPLGSLVLALVVPFVVVVLGTYVGALMALQSFFGESSWQDVSDAEE